ncbi:MAG: RNA polymerase factor sigma-32, partial [Beijerinckiaceae bacterium]
MSDAALLNRQMARAAVAAPYLERADERTLAVLWRQERDESALHQLTRSHMRLAIAIASRFRRYGLPMNDLVQEGHIGLLEAAARFEPDREVRFSTYASWWIRASIQEFVLRNWSIVRGGTSSTQKSLFFNLRRLKAKLSREFPQDGQVRIAGRIADNLGVPVKDVLAMDGRLSSADASMDAPVSGQDGTLAFGELLPDPGPQPDEIVAESIDLTRRQAWLSEAFATLSEREQHILTRRRLLDEP